MLTNKVFLSCTSALWVCDAHVAVNTCIRYILAVQGTNIGLVIIFIILRRPGDQVRNSNGNHLFSQIEAKGQMLYLENYVIQEGITKFNLPTEMTCSIHTHIHTHTHTQETLLSSNVLK